MRGILGEDARSDSNIISITPTDGGSGVTSTRTQVSSGTRDGPTVTDVLSKLPSSWEELKRRLHLSREDLPFPSVFTV